MSKISLTGKDTQIINGRILNDLANGDVTKLTFPTEKWRIKTGKNGNSIYSYSYDGRTINVEMRVLLGSDDDAFLNNLANLADNNPAAFTLLTGTFVKNIGDGVGNITPVTYTLSGGVIKKGIEAVENAEGNEEQAVAVYEFMFTNAARTIGQ